MYIFSKRKIAALLPVIAALITAAIFIIGAQFAYPSHPALALVGDGEGCSLCHPDGDHYDCHEATCMEGGGDVGCPGATVTEVGCPAGYTGSHYFTDYYILAPAPFYCYQQSSETNTCVPSGCSAPTVTDLGCPSGYVGSHTRTTACDGSVSDNNSCQPPVCTGGTTWNGSQCAIVGCTTPPHTTVSSCPVGYEGSRYVTVDCEGKVIDQGGSCTPVAPSGCPDPETVDQGCPAGFVGADTITTWYSNPPVCTPHTTRENQCVPQGATTLTVTSNLASPWTIAPGLSGTGSATLHPTPSAGGTIYTLTPASVSGYAYPPLVTNSVTGAGSSFLMFPGQTAGFTIAYSSLVASFDYSLSNSGTVTVMKGGRPTFGQATITKTLTSGTGQSTDLSLSGVPANVSYQFANAMCSPTCTSTITFTVDAAAAVGTYPITVTGTGGKTTSFNLVIDNSPNMSVTCVASPTPALVGQNVTWTGNVTGGVPPYTYVWSGTNVPNPAPTTQSFSTTYSTVGAKTAQLHVTDSLSNVATCTPAGTVQINFNPQFKEI